MNAMSFMKALGDIPEDLVRCYFDEPSAAANNTVPSDQSTPDSPASEPVAANPLKPITKSDSEPIPETPARPIQLPLPVSIVAVAACLAFAVGWGVLISKIDQKPISSNDSDEMIYTQDGSDHTLITEPPDSQVSGTDSSRLNTSSQTTASTARHQSSDNRTGQNETTTGTISENTTNHQGTEAPSTQSAAAENTSSVAESTTPTPTSTTVTQTRSTTTSVTTTATETSSIPRRVVSLVGEDIVRRYILNEWADIDCENWEDENPQFVSQPFYQALSDTEKQEIQQKISLLESRPNLGYAMKLRQRIMETDTGTRMTLEELKEYLSTHTVTDDSSESELFSLIGRTNRYPDVIFGSGRSFAYHFLDENGSCFVYSADDEAPLFVYYDAGTGEFVSVPLRDALSIILNL